MNALSSITPLTWIIIASAALICVTVLFNSAIKLMLKLAVIGVMMLVIAYGLVRAGVLDVPRW